MGEGSRGIQQGCVGLDKSRTQPSVDLNVNQSSLPAISELLVSEDMEMGRTALIALQHNGAEVESDARWDSPSTRFDVKFPDGSVGWVEFTQ